MYKPLAIKYRPKNLNEVIGQDLIVRIVKSAIQSGKLNESIILTGIRGTGKTSLARIIAKAVNCSAGDDKPCCQCDNCMSVDGNKSFDIIEMDAASNTGVDDIRTIIESCQYRSAILKYKVFIIDEVHMLSKSAFNALLKTLEEPPSHVRFIFATTEIDKVPDTIISRCLRLDLQRVSSLELTQYLSKIANLESVNIEPKAIHEIVKVAGGSVRDSLSILEQVFHLPHPIKAAEVSELLGIIDNEALIGLFEAMALGEVKEAIQLARTFYNKVSSVKAIFNGLLELLHFVICDRLEVVDISDYFISDESKAILRKVAKNLSIPSLNQIWQVIHKGLTELGYTADDQLTLEIAVIRVCYLSPLPDLYSLINDEANSRAVYKGKEPEEKGRATIESMDDIRRIIGRDSVLSSFFDQHVSLTGVVGDIIKLCASDMFTTKLKSRTEEILSSYGYKVQWDLPQTNDLVKKALGMFPDAKIN